jgi:hypothetical protein
VPDDDRIEVSGGNAPAELLAVFGFKVFAGSNKNICCRLEL